MDREEAILILLGKIDNRLDEVGENINEINNLLSSLDMEKIRIEIARITSDTEKKFSNMNETLNDNVKRVNFMLLEMKGVVSIVRPNLRFWANDQIKETDDFKKSYGCTGPNVG